MYIWQTGLIIRRFLKSISDHKNITVKDGCASYLTV